MLPDELLTDYANKFYGFGTWSAKIWFVGIEEAGGRQESDVQARLDAWEKSKSQDLEDAPTFYPASGNTLWHGEGATIQPTWKQLIRMLLVARGRPDSDEEILNYQRGNFGRTEGRECLAELLPLPSPSTKEWNYKQWTNLHWLQNRTTYLARILASRENELRRQVGEHKPNVVIFYGLELPNRVSLLPSWSSIAGGRFVQAFKDREIFLMRETTNTTFYVTRHPRAESDEYFRQIGSFLREKHGNQTT